MPKYLLKHLLFPALAFLFFPALGQSELKGAYERLTATQQEYEKAIQTTDTAAISELCYLLGKRYIAVGDFPKAQRFLLKSLDMRKKEGLSENNGKVYMRLAEIQFVLKQIETSQKYSQLAQKNFEHVQSRNGLFGLLLLKGEHFRLRYILKSENVLLLDSALYYYNRSLRFADKNKESTQTATVLQSIGSVYHLRQNFDAGLKYYEKALKIYERTGAVNNITELSGRLALELALQKQTAEVKPWLARAIKANVGSSAHAGVQESILHAQSMYYEQIGNVPKALSSYKQLLDYRSNNLEAQRRESIAGINQAHENELSLASVAFYKKQTELQQRHIASQKTVTKLVVAMLGLVGIACALFYRLFVKHRKLSRHHAILVKEQNHRTKNNLQSISDLLNLQMSRLSDPEAVKAMEESLLRVQAMTMLHRSLYSDSDLVHIDLQKYIRDLMASVFRTYNLPVSKYFDIAPVLLHSDKAIPLGLIVNELTTNACKYAFSDNDHPQISVRCSVDENQILFQFSDNGPGGLPQTTTGFGMELIALLSAQLHGNFGYQEQSGCTFTLSFPAETKPAQTSPRDKREM